jgi:hypothetical protein
MEPVTTALIAALAKMAEPAVKDAYEGLKALLVKKLGARNAVLDAVGDLEKKPDSAGRRETLHEEVTASAVANDPDIVAAARTLLENVQRVGGGQQTVQQNVHGNRNIFSGTGDINIGGKPP